MKKLLNISVIAALAILPMAANADPIYDVTTTDPGATNANGPEAANAPKYSLAAAGANDDNHMATAGYVKGAYNAAIKAINKVATTADSAVKGVKVNGSELTPDANGKVNVTVAEGATDGTVAVNGTDVAVHGLGSAAYEDTDAFATAAQGIKADNAETHIGTMANLTGGETTLVEAIEAVRTTADGAVQSVTTGTTDGTINVDGTDVAVHGLGSAAYTASTAYASAAQGTKADNAETLLGNSAMGTTATTVTGAIAELKTASGNYATQNGVENTIETATITATVPTLTTWGSDSSTSTVGVTVSSIAATYAEPTPTLPEEPEEPEEP
ncbi:MAG: hypothetical protein J6W27_00065 [Alphaproteobacteria bacterium]|nr:hypothetical protein [Alphaproteobacteria bacterium]